jgi:CheY-like chemotaxis protein
MNILIVDDDTTTLTLLRRILLREFSCTVAEAHGGLAALALLAERSFDLIITDLTMPMMNGLELIEAVRQHQALNTIPVVVMSVERKENRVRRAIELGIAAYVVKPLDALKVAQRLRPVIDNLPLTRGVVTSTGVAVPADGAPGKAAYLVVDGSADFRHFFASVFEGERAVMAEATGVAALSACLKTRPGVVFVGDDIGVLNAELLARKLRTSTEFGTPDVVRIMAGRLETATAWEQELDGIVRRTLVPDAFRTQTQRVLGHRAHASGVLLNQPTLRREMASAAVQVFGMMMWIHIDGAV